MKKKIIKRYILLCLPFMCGLLLYGVGNYGIVSSLLFFVGGYVLIKNVFDYRVVMKNINKYVDNGKKICINEDSGNEIVLGLEVNKLDDDISKLNNYMDEDVGNIVEKNNDMDTRIIKEDDSKNRYRYGYMNSDNIPGLKTTRRYIKIRRRY